MDKLKRALGAFKLSKASPSAAVSKEETPETRYEAARDLFLEYNAQLEGASLS